MVVATNSRAQIVHRNDDERSIVGVSAIRDAPTGDTLPQPMEIHRAQRTIVQSVTRLACLAPDHPSVIRAYRSIESCLMKLHEHRAHVDVANPRGMSGLLKGALADPL